MAADPIFRRLRAGLVFAAAILLGCSARVSAQAQSNPMLHREGSRIVDGKGRPVFLRGVNLGGWLEWELWIFGGAIGPGETSTLNRLAGLVGAEEARKFHAAVQEAFITEADIAEIARMGFNTVRVTINRRLLEEDEAPFVYKDSGWKILDRLVAWCEKHRLYAILELHSAPGGQCPADLMDADPKGQQLWDLETKRKRTVALWTAIARRYSGNRTVGGYDLLNEPIPSGPGGPRFHLSADHRWNSFCSTGSTSSLSKGRTSPGISLNSTNRSRKIRP